MHFINNKILQNNRQHSIKSIIPVPSTDPHHFVQLLQTKTKTKTLSTAPLNSFIYAVKIVRIRFSDQQMLLNVN
jgi:hypothetical protein